MFSAFKLFKVQKQKVYIIIANGYTTKQDLELSKSRYLTMARKKKLRVHKHEAREGLGAKFNKTECDGSVSGVPCEMAVEGDRGRWWDEVDKVVVAAGVCICKREAGGKAGAKSDETKCNGSVSGVSCKTAVEGNGGRWWDEVDKVAVVVGLCIRKCEAGGGAGAKSDETERNSSVSGTPCETVVESDGGRWWDKVDKVTVVVELCVRKREPGGGLGPNPMKLSVMAQFQAHHTKWRWRAMGGGGGMRWIRWSWLWGPVFANGKLEGGLGAKTPMAWFRAAFEQQGANGVLWDCSPPPSCGNLHCWVWE
jgi:hypothetical protein